MIKAIIYHSNTGYTFEYAKLLSEILKIPYYSLEETNLPIKKEDEIIYLSWICAGKITKLKQVQKNYQIKCIGAVGAYNKSEKYLEELKSGNQIQSPCFYLQGGINYQKLKGISKLIVKMVGKTIPKEEKELVNLFQNGGSFVKKENLKELINYVKEEEK